MRLRAAALLLLSAAVARGDKLDQLGQALLADPSFRVRVQAAIVLGKLGDRRAAPSLVRALGDEEVAVRVVAANSLGRLGDPAALEPLRARMDDPAIPVRTAAGKAIAAIEAARDRAPAGAPASRRVALDVTPVAPGAGRPEQVRWVQDKLQAQLGRIPDVTLQPEPGARRYYVDSRIARLSAGKPDADGRVTVECDLGVIVATHPDHAIKMMATVGGSLDERNDPGSIAGAMSFCLGDAAKQAADKVMTYLQGAR